MRPHDRSKEAVVSDVTVSIPDKVRSLMPELVSELVQLVDMPSISYLDHTPPALLEARDFVVALLQSAGVDDIETLSLPDTAPVIVGSIPAPEGAPTVLLYAHYDVVPGGDESLWSSPPFEAVERDGAVYGRGSSDCKANIIGHIGALRAWEGRPPVGIKILIEGQEEIGGGALNGYPATNPEAFSADAMLIADMGSVRPGVPALTIALRGMAQVTIEVTTLASAKHSGQYGGAAPDALLTVLRALTSLHDEIGDVAVPGLRREPWTGATFSDEEFRELAEIEPGLPLLGTGDLGSRLWSGPAITVTGIDVPSVDNALNAVSPYARASLNVRVHPAQDPVEAQAAVIEFLRNLKPYGIELDVRPGATGQGFSTGTSGSAYTAVRAAMETAWGVEPVNAATGGSIPLVAALQGAVPDAEIMLLGATDGYSNIHGPDERVMLDELEKWIVAEAEFFANFAAAHG
jgi:acetylornithine deacetylase/succinyl-diaminopimelate desuccinylase-like protein